MTSINYPFILNLSNFSMVSVACSSLHLRFFTWCLLSALTLENIL